MNLFKLDLRHRVIRYQDTFLVVHDMVSVAIGSLAVLLELSIMLLVEPLLNKGVARPGNDKLPSPLVDQDLLIDLLPADVCSHVPSALNDIVDDLVDGRLVCLEVGRIMRQECLVHLKSDFGGRQILDLRKKVLNAVAAVVAIRFPRCTDRFAPIHDHFDLLDSEDYRVVVPIFSATKSATPPIGLNLDGRLAHLLADRALRGSAAGHAPTIFGIG